MMNFDIEVMNNGDILLVNGKFYYSDNYMHSQKVAAYKRGQRQTQHISEIEWDKIQK